MTFTPKFVDLVRNFTTVQGTGPVTLGSSVTGFTSINDALSAGDQFYYCLQSVDKPVEREVGRGTLQADGKVARQAVQGALTHFSSGTKTIALVAAAEWFDKLESGAGGGSIEAATRTALAAAPASRGPALLTEAGREGLFVFKSGDLTAKVGGDARQAVYVPPASNATGAAGAWVRSFSGAVNVRWFGAVGDDATNDGPAFVAALAFCKSLAETGYGYGKGSPKLFVPSGKYFLGTTTLDITHTLIIEGENCGNASGASTVLRFAANTTGIRTQAYNTSGGSGGVVTTDHLGAGNPIIRNLALIGGFAGTEGEHHAIHLRAGATIRDIYIDGFAGDGIHSNVSTGSTTHAGNTNGILIENVFARYCRDGIHIENVDANGWTIINPHTSLNRRYGIWKKTTLGGTIVGGLSESNGLWAGGTPTRVSHNGNRYYCLPNQEAGASTNAPSGTMANNIWWGFMSAGGVAGDEYPAWVSGMAIRAGGSLRIEGSFEQNVVLGWYREPDQSPPQVEASAATLWLSPMGGHTTLFDGSRGGHGLTASGAGMALQRGLTVGEGANDGSVPVAGAGMAVRGDLYLTRANTIAHDPIFHLNTTSAYSTFQFEHQGNARALFQYDVNNGLLYFTHTNKPHLYYVNSALVGQINSTGIDLASGKVLKVNGTQVVGGQGAAVANATDAASAITQLNALLERCRAHGLIAT